MIHTPCILFAGGKSSRMGRDKSLLPFGGAPTLIQYQYQRLLKIFSHVYILTKDPNKYRFDAEFIHETDPLYSPVAGFCTLFEQKNDEAFFVLSVDTPFVTREIIDTLIKTHTTTFHATLAHSQKSLEPLCGVYSQSAYQCFRTMRTENRLALKQIEQCNIQTVCFQELKPFTNINYPKDYQKALQSAIIQP